MIRCSPSGSRLCDSRDICQNWVNFVNVKTNYQIDEDLVLDYTLKEEFISSTRDWIGIFPRNWSNFQQYLTFEYTLQPPLNSANPLNRTVTFPRIFHREAPLNWEYQFVYVSKEIKVMATSTYFRFTPSHCNISTAKRCPCVTNICSGAEGFTNSTVNKTEVTQRPPIQGVRPNCPYCHRKVCGLKIDALRGDFLATFSDSLLNRVHRLERDLSFAESALKNAKGVRENLAKRLRSYEAFVAEMLKSLAVRGSVKITDEKGTEIVLQRVNEDDSDTGTAKSALEDQIVALKRLLQEQQQTVAKLTEQKRFNSEEAQRDRANCDRSISLIDRQVQTSPESPLKFRPTQHSHKKQNIEETSDDCREKGALGMIVKNEGEKLPLEVNLKAKEIETIEIAKLFLKSSEGSRIPSKIVAEQEALKIPKPSGILVQGKATIQHKSLVHEIPFPEYYELSSGSNHQLDPES